MKQINEGDLSRIMGGDNAAMVWGAQAASDGLAAMDSDNEVKQGVGMLLASAGGWVYVAGFIWDMF